MSAKPYQRLPGTSRRSGVFAVSAPRTSLWLGADHLLSLDSTATRETCRRFYYRDIEALVIRQTAGRRNWNLFWLILALLSVSRWVFGRSASLADEGAFLSMGLAGFFLLLLLINSLLGPICKSSLRTAVQIEELPTLGRVRRAQKVFGRLRPRIEEAQGSVGLEQIAQADWSASPADGSSRSGLLAEPESRAGLPRGPRHEPGNLHLALFTLLLADAAFTLWMRGHAADWSDGVNAAGLLAGVFLLIMALRRQHQSDLPAGVRRLTWATGVYYGAGMLIGMAWGVIYSVQHAQAGIQPELMSFRGSPGWSEVTLGSGCVAALIGLSGLGLLLLRKKNVVAAVPPPVPGQA